jgi:hypothetical protein
MPTPGAEIRVGRAELLLQCFGKDTRAADAQCGRHGKAEPRSAADAFELIHTDARPAKSRTSKRTHVARFAKPQRNPKASHAREESLSVPRTARGSGHRARRGKTLALHGRLDWFVGDGARRFRGKHNIGIEAPRCAVPCLQRARQLGPKLGRGGRHDW